MIESKLQSPHLNIPDPSPPNPASPQNSPPPPQRSQRQQQRNQRKFTSLLPSQNNNGYYPEGVVVNLKDSLGILGFTLNQIVSERQIRRRYMMELAQQFHPYKNDPEISGQNREEATAYFQLINNAQEYLRHITT